MLVTKKYFSRIAQVVLFLLVSSICFAQDTKKVDINIGTDDGGGFFASPWMWIVGAAVFILLLVALLRGGSRRSA